MADELKFSGDPASQSGLTVTARVYTSAFAQQGSVVNLSEVGSTAGYLGDMPTAGAGTYIVRYFDGATLLAQESLDWDGDALVTLQTINAKLLTSQNVRDAISLNHTDGRLGMDKQITNAALLKRP